MSTRVLAALAAALFSFPLIAGNARAEEGWLTDMNAAKETAAKEGKDLLIDFTGSDWCVWCKRLEAEVFGTDEFKAKVHDDFVLVRLDFPNDQTLISADEKTQNEALANEWHVTGFPTVVLADATGRPFARTGYEKGGPTSYLALLTKLRAAHALRDAGMKAAEGKSGIERAKAIDQALTAMDPDVARQFYAAEIEEVSTLAKDDAELSKKYAEVNGHRIVDDLDGKIGPLAETGDWDGATKLLDEAIAAHGDNAYVVQQARIRKVQVSLNLLAGKSQWDEALAAVDGFTKEFADDEVVVAKCKELRSRVLVSRLDAAIGPHVEANEWDAATKAIDEFIGANAADAAAVRDARMRKVDVVMNQHGSKNDWDAVIQSMHALAEECKDDAMPRQKALTNESYGYHEKGDLAKCLEVLEAALAADKDGPMAEQVGAIIEQIKREKEGGGAKEPPTEPEKPTGGG